MCKIKINNKVYTFTPGNRVVDLLPDEEKKKWMICEIDQAIKELTYPLTAKHDGSNVFLYDLNHIEGGKAYETTLRYIIAMAFKRCYRDINIKFSYSVSRSVFCEIMNSKVKMSHLTESIIAEVKRIIALDLPIIRKTVSVEDAISIYEKQGNTDKIKILK